jgi:hypothetical protein
MNKRFLHSLCFITIILNNTTFLLIWAILFPSYIQDYCIKTSSILRDVAQCRVVVHYRRYGTLYQFHLQGSSSLDCLTTEAHLCPETTVTNCLTNIPRRKPEMSLTVESFRCTIITGKSETRIA